MAEPARRLDDEPENKRVYDTSGTERSDPRAHLKALEDGGETTGPKRGHLKPVDGETGQDLSDRESNLSDTPQHENQVGRGYQGEGASLGRFSLRDRITKKRAALGGGLAGTIIALLMFLSFAGGPFGFIHIAQLLEKFHFAGLQSQQDTRFTKEVRFLRYFSKGEVEKTRMGFIGNKYADRFETKLNASGLTSAYTDKFGFLDGYVIDKTNERFKGMSDEEIKQYVKQNYGVDAVSGSEIKGSGSAYKNELLIKAADLQYVGNLKLAYGVLRDAGYSKMSAAIGARMFCVRAGCNWHPLTKLSGGNLKRLLEEWTQKDRASKETGQDPLQAQEDKTNSKDSNNQQDNSARDQAGNSINDTSSGAADAGKDPTKMAAFRESIAGKLAGGGAAAIGILCMVKGINNEAGQIKQAQVVLPLIRMGVEAMSLGNQLESGQDVDLNELGVLNKQLSGTDSSRQYSSWDQSQSIQANLGNNVGTPPDGTLKSIDSGVPFGFINNIVGLGPACSTVGQSIIGVFSIALDATVIGGLVNQAGGFVVSQFALGPIAAQIAQWLAGKAVDVGAIGADYGNAIDFGATLAANSQNISAGGRQLSPAESAQISLAVSQQYEQQFKSQSIAYRLFNPYDPNTAAGRLIDASGQGLNQNIAKMKASIFNVGTMFKNISTIFTRPAFAAGGGTYDYGFPIYGFSESDMNNPLVENPYDNVCHLFGCPDQTATHPSITGIITDSNGKVTSTGASLIQKASNCFGVNIAPDASGRWGVTSSSTDPKTLPNPYDDNYKKIGCDDTSDNWTRVRFFIMDTETMNSMGCYEGDSQACSDIGMDSSGSNSGDTTLTTNPNGSGSIDEGTNAELAQKLLGYRTSGQYNCDNPGDCTDLQKIVSGQSLAGSDGCQAQTLDPRVLKLLLYLIENGGFKIGTFALCGDHHFDGVGGHSGGLAVDISTVNGASLAQDTQSAATEGLKLDKYLNNLPANIKLDQQISYGYGGHYYQPMAATQQYGGQLCNSSCVSTYTQDVENEHTNHIHAGY